MTDQQRVEILREALRRIAYGYDDGVGSCYYSGTEAALIAELALQEARNETHDRRS